MPSFGARLKQEREQRKITLDDISATTKIGTRMLRALEDEHFDQLPGGVFNKGFVRAYARHLGVDEDQAVADYLEAIGETQPGKGPESAPASFPLQVQEERRTEVRIPWGGFAIALLLVAIGFAVWGFRSRRQKNDDQQTRPHPASAASTGSGPVNRSAMVEPTKSSGNIAASAQPTQTAPAASDNSVPPAGSLLVRIQAREDCWISITADGGKLTEYMLIAPMEKSVQAQKEIVVRAGNIGALDFSLNGRKLPAQGDYGEVKTLIFDSNGLRVALKTQPPGGSEIVP